MAVHAHPDDEASSTGGILARYAAEGVKTVVVTCTNGAMGDAPGGLKPGEDGFDEDLVVAMRQKELQASCEILGVNDLELLNYQDSGMMGWPQNDAPNSFWQMSVEDAAAPLIALMERHRPDVVVTYDANGSYGHPDHIQAHRIALHASEVTGIPAKVYFTGIPRSAFRELAAAMKAAGMSFGDPDEEGHEFGTPDEVVTTRIDCSSVVRKKHAALYAHASQTAESFFLKLPDPLFDQIFSFETFVRYLDRTNSAVPESDLFVGLR